MLTAGGGRASRPAQQDRSRTVQILIPRSPSLHAVKSNANVWRCLGVDSSAAQLYCCLLPLMLPATPPATAPTAAPVQPLPPAMAAIPAPAAAPMAAPLTVPCCSGVIVVHPITSAAAAIAPIVPNGFMFRLLYLAVFSPGTTISNQ